MKRAQVTIFIILGLIILLGSIIAYVAFKDSLVFRPDTEQISSELETQLRPFETSVRECQERLTDEALIKILIGGGYIDNPELFSAPNAAGNAIDLQGLLIPYWHHIRNGQVQYDQPPLDVIRSQIATYVDERIQDCVPWDIYPDFIIEENSNPTSTVSSNNNEVRTVTQWEISVEAPAGVKYYPRFEAHIQAPLNRLYNAASEILRQTRNNHVPELTLLKYIDLYSAADSSIPPIQGTTEIGGAPNIYDLQHAREELLDVASLSAQTLQLWGSQNARIALGEIEAINDIRLEAIIRIDEPTTEMIYQAYNQEQDLHWRVNNNPAFAMSELSRIHGLDWILPGAHIQDNTFLHDISLPMVMTLEQDGYLLQFGYEINIRNNQPQTSGEESVAESSRLCTDSTGAQATIRSDISDAAVIMSCSEITCPLGELVNGELQTTLPVCAQATVELVTTEGFSSPAQITSVAGQNLELDIAVLQPQQANIDIQGQYLREVDGQIELSNPESIPADAIFIRQGEQPYVARSNERGEITLVPGTYEVIVMYIKQYPEGQPFVIEEDTIEADGEEIVLERIELQSLPIAFADFSGDNTFTLTRVPEQITITIPALREDNIKTHQDLTLIGELFELTEQLDSRDAIELIN